MTPWLLRAVGACKNRLAESGFRNARTWQPPSVADMGMDGRFALHGGRSEKEVRLTELGRVETFEYFSWSIFDFTQMMLRRVRQKAAKSGQMATWETRVLLESSATVRWAASISGGIGNTHSLRHVHYFHAVDQAVRYDQFYTCEPTRASRYIVFAFY